MRKHRALSLWGHLGGAEWYKIHWEGTQGGLGLVQGSPTEQQERVQWEGCCLPQYMENLYTGYISARTLVTMYRNILKEPPFSASLLIATCSNVWGWEPQQLLFKQNQMQNSPQSYRLLQKPRRQPKCFTPCKKNRKLKAGFYQVHLVQSTLSSQGTGLSFKGKENSSGCTSRTSVPLWRRAEEVNLYFLLREKQMWKTWRAEFCCVLPC